MNKEMTLNEAESMLAANAVGMFYGTQSELARAILIVNESIKKELENEQY